MKINYKEALIEYTVLQEAIPWRSGKIPIELGKTSYQNLKQDCLILNELKLIHLKPTFMIVIPDISALAEQTGGTNGMLLISAEGQQMEYKVTESGMCRASTYFFGRPKEGRTADWFFRMFEKGFSVEKFSGLRTFPETAKLEISVAKAAQRSRVQTAKGPRMRKALKIPCRIKRVR